MYSFGHSSHDSSLYSETTTDRYGFTSRPAVKINVSATGKVEKKALSPILTSRRLGEKGEGVSIEYIRRIFSSPWMKDYKHLGQCLIHAINEDRLHPEAYTTPRDASSDFSRTEPYFLGCSPNSENITIFNGHNLHISIYLTEENQKKEAREILLFGDIKHRVPDAGFKFNIIAPDGEPLGKAHASIINREGRTIVRLGKIVDFVGNHVGLSDFPFRSNLLAAFDLKGNPPPDGLIHRNKGKNKPYFEDCLWDDENYVQLKNGHLKLNILVPPGSTKGIFYIPVTDLQMQTKMEVKDERGKIIGSALVYIEVSGRCEIMALEKRPEISDDLFMPSMHSIYCYQRIDPLE